MLKDNPTATRATTKSSSNQTDSIKANTTSSQQADSISLITTQVVMEATMRTSSSLLLTRTMAQHLELLHPKRCPDCQPQEWVIQLLMPITTGRVL